MAVLSDTQRAAVADWVAATAPALRLADWQIIIATEEPTIAPGGAEVVVNHPYQEAVIWVDADLFKQGPEFTRRVLVHELIHIHHGAFHDRVIQEILTEPGVGETDLVARVSALIDEGIEPMVEQLARIVVDIVDLPEISPVIDAEPAIPGIATGGGV